jgi:8-oxo-dGTP pyrophosphatase MutT (NUDIX family)
MPVPPHVAALRAHAAVRECYEETGIIAVPEALTSVTVSGLITHDSGDLTRHLDITFRCRAIGGQPRPADGELQDVCWHDAAALPALPAYELRILTQALHGDSQTAYGFAGISGALRSSGGLHYHERGGPSEPEAE